MDTKTGRLQTHDLFQRHINELLSKLNPGVQIRSVRVSGDGKSIAFIVGDFVGPAEALVVATLDGQRVLVNPQLNGSRKVSLYPSPLPLTWLGDGHTLVVIGDTPRKTSDGTMSPKALFTIDRTRPKAISAFPLAQRSRDWFLMDSAVQRTMSDNSVPLLFLNEEKSLAELSRFSFTHGRESAAKSFQLPSSYAVDEASISPDGKMIAWVLAPRPRSRDVPNASRELWLCGTHSSTLRFLGTLPADLGPMQPRSVQWLPSSGGISYVVGKDIYLLPVGPE